MNRNLFDWGKGRGLIFALLALLVAVPILGIPAITGVIIYYIILKNRQNESKVEDLSTQVSNVKVEQELNPEDYRKMYDSQKRLEGLKNLYDNGFMSKDEYNEKRNKIINGA